VENYCRAGKATDGNMGHKHCMLDTLGYKHTLRIGNTYFIFHSNNGQTNSPHCPVIRKLRVQLLQNVGPKDGNQYVHV
jgi:hypothetical protein